MHELKLGANETDSAIAEAKAKTNQDLYQNALKAGQQALAQKEFTVAQSKYQEAGQLYQTDAVITGLHQVEAARTQSTAETQAAKRKIEEDSTRTTRLRELVAKGQVAIDTKDYSTAVSAFTQAKKLDPDNVDVLTGLTRAEQGRDRIARVGPPDPVERFGFRDAHSCPSCQNWRLARVPAKWIPVRRQGHAPTL